MREAFIENKLRLYIKKLRGLCLKFISPSMAGVPDRIILLPGGRFYFVELKSSTGVLSPVQKVIHRMFERLGFKVYVVSTLEELAEFITIITTS